MLRFREKVFLEASVVAVDYMLAIETPQTHPPYLSDPSSTARFRSSISPVTSYAERRNIIGRQRWRIMKSCYIVPTNVQALSQSLRKAPVDSSGRSPHSHASCIDIGSPDP